jgi:hypothetical protein
VNIMPMEGSSYIFKTHASIVGSGKLPITTLHTHFSGFCVCSLVRLDETFKVCWSWVGIINYSIKIVLVFDGFLNYHFEPHQNMRNSLFVCEF